MARRRWIEITVCRFFPYKNERLSNKIAIGKPKVEIIQDTAYKVHTSTVNHFYRMLHNFILCVKWLEIFMGKKNQGLLITGMSHD